MANYENMGALVFENLMNSAGNVPVITGLRTVKSGQGVLKAGSVLALSAGTAGSGKFVLLGTTAASNETLTANCILAEDVDTTGADAAALVYLSGHVNRNALAVKSGYTISAADVEDLRKGGIFVANAVL